MDTGTLAGKSRVQKSPPAISAIWTICRRFKTTIRLTAESAAGDFQPINQEERHA